RRQRLSQRIGPMPALIAAGRAPSRNYPANAYPFRAGSHFLYFVGLPLGDSFLLVEGADATLFVTPPDPADELWHGPTPSMSVIAEATGCRVRPLSELERKIAGRNIATIAAVDLATRLRQEEILGRTLAKPTESDERLMDAIIELRLVHDEAALTEMRAAAE